MSRKPRPLSGVEFKADSKGNRSTTEFGKTVWASSVSKIDEKLAEEIKGVRNWRHGYARYIRKNVELSLKSPHNAMIVAKEGIRAMYDGMEFIRDEKAYELEEAMEKFREGYKGKFFIGEHSGNGVSIQKSGSGEYVVPYKGKNLTGEELIAQVKQWSEYGTIEKSTAQSLISIAKNKDWLNQIKNKVFIILGAASQMCCFELLMNLGATVVALDIDFPRVWQRIFSFVEKGSGKIFFPLKKDPKELKFEEYHLHAGANLSVVTPEISGWLQNVLPDDKQPIIGSYVYLNGALFVKVATACDMIMADLCKNRKDAMLAFLCTPTDAHCIPKEAWEAAKSNHRGSWKNLVCLPFELLPIPKMKLVNNVTKPVKTDDGNTLYWVDGLVVDQGPNYATSKRLQHWRCIVENANDHKISSNIAPSSSTASVVQNKSFAWAYSGMPFFKPMEIFEPSTSRAVMTALLLADIFEEKSDVPLKNPLQLFTKNSFHGGAWRSGYTMGSMGGVSVLIHFARQLPVLLVGLFVLYIFFMRFFM